jgi:hypothetical protein
LTVDVAPWLNGSAGTLAAGGAPGASVVAQLSGAGTLVAVGAGGVARDISVTAVLGSRSYAAELGDRDKDAVLQPRRYGGHLADLSA